ncbi:hypothetical protein [Streptomyces sp. NPDC051173]|uniref:hypothetical protein n=1 Tax=Streptomyces sp. NPDC051173 TaxID=3155164 RepID=UPI003450BB2B
MIAAAWECGRSPVTDQATEAAQALEDAGLLMSPEVAAELERLRAQFVELERRPGSEPPVRSMQSPRDKGQCHHGRVLLVERCADCENARETVHDADLVSLRTGMRGRPSRRCRVCGLRFTHRVHRSA